MGDEGPAPDGVDIDMPNVARMYDYYLGGKDNFAADRAAAEEVIAMVPEVRAGARANRRFLGRTVRYLARRGIRQFIDIGTGLPTQGTVHENAPGARVVYVDNDPVVLVHSRALLAGVNDVAAMRGDLRKPRAIIDDARKVIDFREPVAVLLIAIMHFVEDADRPEEIITTLREALPQRGYLAMSHGTGDGHEEQARHGTSVYRRANARLALRSRDEILRLFDGFELIEPGLVWLSEWRPDMDDPVIDPEDSLAYGGVGMVKP